MPGAHLDILQSLPPPTRLAVIVLLFTNHHYPLPPRLLFGTFSVLLTPSTSTTTTTSTTCSDPSPCFDPYDQHDLLLLPPYAILFLTYMVAEDLHHRSRTSSTAVTFVLRALEEVMLGVSECKTNEEERSRFRASLDVVLYYAVTHLARAPCWTTMTMMTATTASTTGQKEEHYSLQTLLQRINHLILSPPPGLEPLPRTTTTTLGDDSNSTSSSTSGSAASCCSDSSSTSTITRWINHDLVRPQVGQWVEVAPAAFAIITDTIHEGGGGGGGVVVMARCARSRRLLRPPPYHGSALLGRDSISWDPRGYWRYGSCCSSIGRQQCFTRGSGRVRLREQNGDSSSRRETIWIGSRGRPRVTPPSTPTAGAPAVDPVTRLKCLLSSRNAFKCPTTSTTVTTTPIIPIRRYSTARANIGRDSGSRYDDWTVLQREMGSFRKVNRYGARSSHQYRGDGGCRGIKHCESGEVG